jgi:hypothetical protein
MKAHAHKELISKWLDDTSLKFETFYITDEAWHDTSVRSVLLDIDGGILFRAKDPYAELREAYEEGLRVVWKDAIIGSWHDFDCSNKGKFYLPVDCYKIVDEDVVMATSFLDEKLGFITVEIKKCGITGNMTAKIVS